MQSTAPGSVTGYENRRITKPAEWHGLVVADVFLNNVAIGLFLVAAVADLTAPGTLATVARLAYPLALVCLTADLICLVLDLGDPWRFHHMLRVVKLSSPMSLGVWCLTLFSFPLAVLVAIDLLPEAWGVPRWLHVACVLSALLPAFGSLAYKGVLFSTSAQPGWREARWLGAYFVGSALALGCSILLTLALLSGAAGEALLRPAFGLLVLLSAVPLVLLIRDLRPLLVSIYHRKQLNGLAAITLGTEFVLPLVLLSIGSDAFFALVAVLGFMSGALLLRWVFVYIPHSPA